MDLKKSYWNYQCGNRGFIFLLDTVIALFIILIVLLSAVFFVSRAEESTISRLQATKISNDIFAVLDYTNSLKTLDTNQIKNDIISLLPEGYSMEFKIECPERTYDSRTNLDENYLFASERVFVNSNNNVCLVRYWIWLE